MGKDGNMEAAFVHLVANHQSELRAFVTSMMPGSSDIDDVIQEANQIIWEKRAEFTIGSNFKAWMFSVARFQIMAAWRDRKRQKEWSVPEKVLNQLLDEAVAGTGDRAVPDHEALHECLTRLRSKDRTLILRRYFDGWRVRKVAAEIGRSEDSVKVSLNRIRANLGICIRRMQNKRKLES